ncbi:MAG: transposase [Gemmatimonadaceae bacterium]|nr:transposase [Gemmatimonadaceae bacterium]
MNYAACIGWDWASKTHELFIREIDTGKATLVKLPHSAPELHTWAMKMRAQYEGRSIAVAIEGHHKAVIGALMAYEFISIYMINPEAAANFRQSFHPSAKKDDPVDAEELCSMIERHEEKLRKFDPADAQSRLCGMLSETRRKFVEILVALVQSLRANLETYYPQALMLAGELDSPMAGDFLRQWPTFDKVARSREATVAAFYAEHRSRSAKKMKERLEYIKTSYPLTNDRALMEAGQAKTRALVEMIQTTRESIAKLEKEIKAAFDAHEKVDVIRSLPGLGDALGPRVAAIVTADPMRFQSAEELQQITGVAPIRRQTGKRKVQVLRRSRRPVFVHQTMVEWAGASLAFCPWAKAFYDLQKLGGHGHFSVLRKLAYKWIRILYRCLQTGTLYDETIHQASLKKRGSPVALKLAA